MKLAIIANPQKYAVKQPFLDALDWADEHDVKLYYSHLLEDLNQEQKHPCANITTDEEEAIDEADIIVAIGGDGTMLYTARIAKNTQKPILGVNSGRLGFMAYTQQGQIKKALNDLHSGNYELDRRFMLQARDKSGTTWHALNEFLFSKKDSASMITVEAEYNGMLINRYWADGIIVASPTGSTAYNLSSSGPIVMPNTNVMVLTPINPHTLTTRPLVLPSDKSLKITIRRQPHEVLFSYDGEICEIGTYPLEVEIRRSNFTIDLVQLPGQSYFETLRNKLMWGMDSREKMDFNEDDRQR